MFVSISLFNKFELLPALEEMICLDLSSQVEFRVIYVSTISYLYQISETELN